MIKQHSRKQIIEAIRYWKGVLQKISESKSELLDACSKEFGEAVVFSDKLFFEYSTNNIYKTFKILDKFIFNSKLNTLKSLKIYSGTHIQINTIAINYNKQKSIDLSGNFAVYFPDLTFGKNRQTGRLMMYKDKEAIFINTDNKCGSFAYLLSTLCHEMIHCYDMNFGSLSNKTRSLIENGVPTNVIDYTSHFTPVFKSKSILMKQESNLTMRISGNDKSFTELNQEDADEICLLKEGDDMSDFEPFVFSDEFKQKYKDLFSFNGPNSAAMIFGQQHHKFL